MHTRRDFGRVILGGVAATAFSARAVDWTSWRGPKGDGKSPETGLLQHWPEGGPKLVWDATGIGMGYSAVSTSGDKVFTSGDVDGQSAVLCLEAKDGKRVWMTPIGKPGTLGCCNADGPRATPSVDPGAGLVFAVAQHGEIAALDQKTGKVVWKKDLVADFKGFKPDWGFSQSPVLDGEHVIFTPGGSGGTVVALKKKTGETVWQSTDVKEGEKNYSPVVVATIGGVKQYVQLTEASVMGLNPKDGKILWQAKRIGRTAVIPTPIVTGNLVYVTSGYGVGCNLFEVKKEGEKFTAEQVYASPVMQNHHGGVILHNDHVYGFSEGKGWTCQELKTGKMVWSERAIGKGAIAYADNRFIIRKEDGPGTIALIEASTAGYKEHGKFDQPSRSKEKSWPHPIVSNGKLYIRDEDHLLCYDISAKS